MQTGDRTEQAMVFKAHAVPQGLCANLVNELKLLANQQKITEYCEGPRHSRAVCVNALRLRMSAPLMLDRYAGAGGAFQVRKPKVPEGSSDVIVRESRDELTLRAEEVKTSKALMNVGHIQPGKMEPSPG